MYTCIRIVLLKYNGLLVKLYTTQRNAERHAYNFNEIPVIKL